MHLGSIVARAALRLLTASGVWFYAYSIYAAVCFFSRRPAADPRFRPPVSILKPIRGLDPDTYENLASFCRQDYPAYQISFGVQDADDPAVAVVRRIIEDFPHLDMRLVVDGRAVGTNPKVCNLANMLAEASYPLLLLSDSDIRVGPRHVAAMAQRMQDPGVGVVTCLYRSRAEGLAAAFEAVGISTDLHPGIPVARKLEGMTFAVGAAILIRRTTLGAIGGFAAVADYLADDFLLGNLPARAGYRVVLCDDVVEHALGNDGVAEVIRHQMRWARSTRASRPWGYLGLILTQGVTASTLLLLVTRVAPLGWVAFGIAVGTRLLMAWLIGVRYLGDPATRKLLWLVPLRDLAGFALWCWSFAGDTVHWRGSRFRLTRGGKLVPRRAE